ncbi:serine hydrolase domain-containing protein [Bacillus sp. JJ1609]|uniref:serine hydrolase domain-containing protein n=1 Tax=Bacillus sp. JJ1609 TaxID=3122977 RepID=UPI0030001A4A
MTIKLENLHQIIDASMKRNNIPGAAVAVIMDHEIILSKGYGRTTAEDWGVPIRPDTLFRIASVSKLFTGTVIMMLVEKGLIDLDETVQYYVPWFTAADPELSKLITIRMLLSHSSGLPTGDDTRSQYDEAGLLLYMKEVVPTLPILFHPGTAYSYGNHALNIAGFIAEQVTGKSFAAIMQKMLFAPLEMTQTTYDPLKAMTYPLALPHEKNTNENLAISHQFYDAVASYPSYYAFSSINELSKFAMMHLENGVYNNKQLLTAASVKEMRTEQSKWYNLTDGGCGITFFKETKDGVDRYWHYGQYSYQYSSQFILVPDKGLAVIALANGENIFQAGYEIVDELLKGADNETVDTIEEFQGEEPDWAYFEDTYLHSYYGLIEIGSDSAKKFLVHNDQKFELKQVNTDTFIAIDDKRKTVFTIGFPAPTSGQTIKCIVVDSKACPEFTRVYTPDPNDWNNWEGIYSNGQESYEVSIQEDFLIIKDLQTNMDLIGRAIDKNQFLTKEYGLVSFIDIDGNINLEFDFAWRYPQQSSHALSL